MEGVAETRASEEPSAFQRSVSTFTSKKPKIQSRVTSVFVATPSPKKLAGDWTSIQGNFGPRGGNVDLSKIKKYADYHELLADPDIDLVDICLPCDQHEKVVLESLKAGKHTIVEKAIALDIKAADRMVSAAKKAGTAAKQAGKSLATRSRADKKR